MSKAPFILLVNPWITDFAAYDLWAKPLGLLLLGALLREGGCGVALVDCLDRHDGFSNGHPDIVPGVSRAYGTGGYPRMTIAKPEVYADLPRKYHRYGIHPQSLRQRLQDLPRPDLIWVTSIMTYWYPGIRQTIETIREIHPTVPVWLGGIYARLCTRHARENSGAGEIVTLPPAELPHKIAAATGFSLSNGDRWRALSAMPAPALDLLTGFAYAPLLTSLGCPFRCPYCASRILQPQWQRRPAAAVYAEIRKWHDAFGVEDFAFYDDALLLHADRTLKPVLERLCLEGPKIRLHTPNALHIRALTPEWCQLLHASGFTTLRLGLETTRADTHKRWGGKVEQGMFAAAVQHLRAAGFTPSQIGVYLLCGVPGQTPGEVADAIAAVRDAGAQPHLAEYSPLPGTALWETACTISNYDVAAEPLYQNNTFFACRRPDFSHEDLRHLKALARQVRQQTARIP